MSQATYSALSVANYILTHASQPVSNLKLQKMLYFILGFSFVRLGHAIFNDTIEAWTYGPVVRDVYLKFMHNDSNPIKETVPAEIISDKQTRDFLDSLIRVMDSYSGSDLVRITHLPETPWSTIWNDGKGRFAAIPPGLIKAYFTQELTPKNA